MSLNDLSPELVYLIFKFLPWRHLTSVSLVSRQWHIIAFPLLHHTIGLTNGECGIRFIARILAESPDRNIPLQVCSCVRQLYVDLNLTLGHKDLIDFGKAVSKMYQLEFLHWDVSYADDWHIVLGLWHMSLPGLRSLSLVTPVGDSEFSSVSDKVEALTNLRELSIRFEDSNDEFVEEIPTRIVDLIRGASNIQSLNLEFDEDEEDSDSWKPSDLFSALSQDRFPNLRSLRVNSRTLVPIGPFGGSAFRHFLQRHPQLHTIVLDTTSHDTEQTPEMLVVDPEDMASFMPSVRHFEGPCVMFEALLASSLSQRIETLGLIESGAGQLGAWRDIQPRLDSLVSSRLSCLKRLKIYTYSIHWEAVLIGLVDFAKNTPMLEELILGGSTIPQEECNSSILSTYLRLLEYLPHLRTLVIPASSYPSHGGSSFLEDPKAFFLRAGTQCPGLESVHLIDMDWEGRWNIIRERPKGSPVDVVYMRNPRYSPPFGWDECITYDELLGPSWRQETFCDHDAFYLSHWDRQPMIY